MVASKRAGAEKDAEHRHAKRRQHRGCRTEEAEKSEWDGRKRGPRRQQIESAWIGPKPYLRGPAAGGGAKDPCPGREPSKGQADGGR